MPTVFDTGLYSTANDSGEDTTAPPFKIYQWNQYMSLVSDYFEWQSTLVNGRYTKFLVGEFNETTQQNMQDFKELLTQEALIVPLFRIDQNMDQYPAAWLQAIMPALQTNIGYQIINNMFWLILPTIEIDYKDIVKRFCQRLEKQLAEMYQKGVIASKTVPTDFETTTFIVDLRYNPKDTYTNFNSSSAYSEYGLYSEKYEFPDKYNSTDIALIQPNYLYYNGLSSILMEFFSLGYITLRFNNQKAALLTAINLTDKYELVLGYQTVIVQLDTKKDAVPQLRQLFNDSRQRKKPSKTFTPSFLPPNSKEKGIVVLGLDSLLQVPT